MPRAGLTPAIVVEQARRLADEAGADGLTLVALAARLGVALPSLYKHVGGLEDLRVRMATAATEELAERLGEAVAGRSGAEAVTALAEGYREFARTHPGTYALTQIAPAADRERHRAAAERAAGAVFAALRGYGLDGDDAIDAARALRAALHGWVLLEQGGGFGMARDPEVSFQRMVEALERTLGAWPR